jgi:hypothetical protein
VSRQTDQNEVRDRLDKAAEDIIRARSELHEVERIMNLSLPGLEAQALDSDKGGAVLWCDEHERRVADCHKRQDEDGRFLTCEGIPLPKVTDPTGDDALSTRVWADVREAHRRAHRIEGDAAWFVGLVNRWKDDGITPAKVAELADKNAPKCERHLRYGYEVDARGKEPTKVKHGGQAILQDAVRLCRWCEDDVRNRFIDTGERRLPTEHEVHHHARKVRLGASTAA